MALLTREPILQALKAALEPLPYTHAMWEGGAAAFNRVDEWSDIDLQIDVDDEHVADTFAVLEDTLRRLSPIDLRYEIPQPTWHGHHQVFYRLQDASPYLLMDVAVLKHSSTNKFLEPEIHGSARVHFDKSGVVTQAPHLDPAELQERLKQRVAALVVTFDMFQILTLKELNRGNSLEAIAFYYNYTLRPLLELLRIQHSPAHYNFATRYVHYELPQPVVQRLEGLYFVQDVVDLRAKRAAAEVWFQELLHELRKEN